MHMRPHTSTCVHALHPAGSSSLAATDGFNVRGGVSECYNSGHPTQDHGHTYPHAHGHPHPHLIPPAGHCCSSGSWAGSGQGGEVGQGWQQSDHAHGKAGTEGCKDGGQEENGHEVAGDALKRPLLGGRVHSSGSLEQEGRAGAGDAGSGAEREREAAPVDETKLVCVCVCVSRVPCMWAGHLCNA